MRNSGLILPPRLVGNLGRSFTPTGPFGTNFNEVLVDCHIEHPDPDSIDSSDPFAETIMLTVFSDPTDNEDAVGSFVTIQFGNDGTFFDSGLVYGTAPGFTTPVPGSGLRVILNGAVTNIAGATERTRIGAFTCLAPFGKKEPLVTGKAVGPLLGGANTLITLLPFTSRIKLMPINPNNVTSDFTIELGQILGGGILPFYAIRLTPPIIDYPWLPILSGTNGVRVTNNLGVNASGSLLMATEL